MSMASDHHTDSGDSPHEGTGRKRVGKACDRCRLKKSKCDGASPCSRCKLDNSICVFGERKKSHDRVYPKGYVEMLEQQQEQLVNGLRELYRRLQTGEGWTGPVLSDSGNGHSQPLTHSILEAIGALRLANGHHGEFEDDFEVMQQRLFDSGAGPMTHHSSSTDDEYDHSPVTPRQGSTHFPDHGMVDGRLHREPLTPPGSHCSAEEEEVNLQTTPYDNAWDTQSPTRASVPLQTQQVLMQQVFEQRTPREYQFPSKETYDTSGLGTPFYDMPLSLNNTALYTNSCGPCLMPDADDDEDYQAFLGGRGVVF